MNTVATSREEELAARITEAVRRNGIIPAGNADAETALAHLPYPTTRLERWKYTRVANLLDFEAAASTDVSVPAPVLPQLDVHRLIFSAGCFIEGDIIDEGPDGRFIGPLSAALERHPDRVRAAMGKGFSRTEWFAALQATAPQDGGCILLPDGTSTDRPVLIHHHMPDGPVAAQPQHLIAVGAEAEAEAILWYDGTEQAAGLVNGALHGTTGNRSTLTLEIVQDEAGTGHHIGHHDIIQGAESSLTIRTATACAHWLRNDLHIVQDGMGASSTFHGCYLPNGRQFVDHHTRIDHAQPDGRSDELYKGLAADRATAVFNGKIMVHKDAQRIEAYQSNANLILGEQAAMFSKPELEIYADDVRCSHGCTTGQFDKEALFYLRSRGMSKAAAHSLLVQAFLAEVLDGFRPEIRDHVHAVYARRLGWS